MNKKLLIPLVALIVVLVGVLAVVIIQNNNSNSPTPQCTHQWIEADCFYPKTCRICQATEGVAKGHNFSEATCTTPKTCQNCQLTEGVALGHSEVIDVAIAPTCTTTGLSEGKHCNVCNEILVQQIEINENGHSWLDATCTTSKTCSICNTSEGHPNGHNWSEATCTIPQTCQICSVTQGDVKEHSFGDWVVEKYSTCTQVGSKYRECADCHSKETATTPTTQHTYQSIVTPPSCTEKGYTTYVCSCGDNYVSDYINSKGHTEVIDPAIEPTTTSTGLTAGSHCSTCNTVLIEQVVIPKKPSPSESSSFQIQKNDILHTYASLYDYNEYSIDYVEIDKKDTSDSEFQITITVGAVMLLIPEDVDYVPDYIKGYWELVKDGETIDWGIFTISSVEELEYREVSFTCKNLEAGEYTLRFTSYI